jgi:hypothetical protein
MPSARGVQAFLGESTLAAIGQVDWQARVRADGAEAVGRSLLAYFVSQPLQAGDEALGVARQVSWVFDQHASEGLRVAFHQALIRLLLGEPGQLPSPASQMDQALLRLELLPHEDGVVQVLGWICTLVRDHKDAHALALLDQLCQAVPGLYEHWQTPLDLLRVSLRRQEAINLLREGQVEQAMMSELGAVCLLMPLGLVEMALLLVERMAKMLPQVSPSAAQVVCEALRQQLPPSSPTQAREAWARGCASVVEAASIALQEDATEGGWLALARLSKAVDYANWVQAPVPYDWRSDAQALALMREIETLGEDDKLGQRLDAHVLGRLNASLTQGPATLEVDALKARLAPDAVLLDLVYPRHADAGGHVLGITREEIRLFGVEVNEQVWRGEAPAGDDGAALPDHIGEAVSLTLEALLETPRPGQLLTEQAAALLGSASRLMLGNALDWLSDQYVAGKRQLIIVPDGAAHHMPFHLLTLDGEPLAQDWSVSHLPCMELLMREAPAVADSAGVAIFGVATPDQVQAALRSARLVHLACPGGHEMAASLQSLSLTGGLLRNIDLMALDMRGLAVLSLSDGKAVACRVDAAGNPLGIAATALALGARAVVSTLWPVAQDTSTVFFGLMFEALAQGLSPGAALRRAQQGTREHFPLYRDWGAFYLRGVA